MYASLWEVFDLMYKSSQIALSVLISKCLFSLRPILQHSVMGRSSVPHQGQRLPWHFWWLFFDRFWAPDNECLHSRRKLRLYADGEIHVFLFRPLPLSWAIRMVFNRFFVSELLLDFWADLPDDQVFYLCWVSPYTPQHPLYMTFPELCGRLLVCHCTVRERSISAHLGPLNSCFWGSSPHSESQNFPDWYKNAHQFLQTANGDVDPE